MNCTQAHDRLPGLLYGHLLPAEKAGLEKHLAECPACRQEYAALRQVRHLLDRGPSPEVRLDLRQLYGQACDRQLRQGRRWRRVGIALCGAAVVLAVIALGLRMEVRMEPRQLVLRWGTPSAQREPTQSPQILQVQAQRAELSSGAAEEQFQLLSQLIHALADTAEARDSQRRQELLQLRADLRELQRRTAQWRYATERDMDALYTAHFISAKKGEKP